MNKTNIEWSDRTWNPVTGCTKVSQGCKNCYAERFYERFHGHGTFKLVHLHPERLNAPMSWKKPCMIFVNSMSDLFHEAVPFDFIRRVFLTMLDANIHTYQVLTKRPQRAIDFYEWLKLSDENLYMALYRGFAKIWVGVSVEDQQTAIERIPLLLQIPAVVRFLSCEPLLGPVKLADLIGRIRYAGEDIQWVICGGESGPAARPMHPDWAREIRDYCLKASIPFFFKQWGEWRPFEWDPPTDYYDACTGNSYSRHGMCFLDENGNPGRFNGYRWMDGSQAIAYQLETKSEPCCTFLRMGKKNAGNRLDRELHKNFPNLQNNDSNASIRV